MWIHKWPHLSPTVYDSIWNFADFKADMHNVYIKVRNDPEQNWTKILFIAIDDAIYVVLASWPPEWHTLDLATCGEATIQR